MWKSGFVALAALMFASGARAQPPVWIVKDQDSELVLFGSVHVLPPGLDWQPPALARALGSADDLWFELPIDAHSEAQTGVLAYQRGTLPADKSLFKMLPAADSARLLRVSAAYGLSPPLLDRLQPWLAEVALAGAAFRKAGADGGSGVERTIAAEAPASAARRAFESPVEQVDMLAKGSSDEQVASLRQTLKEMEDKPDEFAILLRAWMAGDLAALDRQALQPIRRASPALYKRLVSERNDRWAQALKTRLDGGGRTVVVVGVGHLIGPQGLPARLRALGYSVTGP
jgi:uncharacterized protein YbaP (TraB family)